MINLKNLKKIINESPQQLETKDFIIIHKSVEGYFRRLLLIGLRLNDVKYKTSLDVIKMSYLCNKDLLKKIVGLISLNNNTLIDFENQNPDFQKLEELFFDFTSIYRNRIIHGVDERIYDEVILKYCYYIDKFFLKEFEATLSLFDYNSGFDTPKTWGANRVVNSESINNVIRRLNLGKITKEPKGINSVKNILNSTKYSNIIHS